MAPPTANTFTVTVADASAHSVVQAGIAAGNKLDAALNVLQALQGTENSELAALVVANTWTITITQP